jgi:DNA-binding transcriptional LysR family regulator
VQPLDDSIVGPTGIQHNFIFMDSESSFYSFPNLRIPMDTRFLDSFLIAAECGSLAEAARRMSITPTAMAQRIKALERELGVPLLVRSGRVVRITEGGARLLDRARDFQRNLRDLKATVSADGLPGGLRIGTVRTALSTVMPDLLEYIAQRYPALDAKLEIGVSHELFHQLGANKVDAALVVDPPFALAKSFTWRTLRVEPLVLLAPAHLAHEDHATLLAREPFIRYDRRTWGGALAERYLQQKGLRPHERFELDSPDGIRALVARGLGVALVPNCFRPETTPSNVSLIHLPRNRLARRLGLIWATHSVYGRLFSEMTLKNSPAES